MKLQVAFDRLDLEETLLILDQIHEEIDIIEIGTSLILKYGVEVIRILRAKYPEHSILADAKIFDNVTYELNLCLDAGADIVSILGCATETSLNLAIDIAQTQNKSILIDMLNTNEDQKRDLMMKASDHIIYCFHHGKDDQLSGKKNYTSYEPHQDGVKRKYALAGGVDPALIQLIKGTGFETVIVGGYITKAKEPLARVLEIKEALR